MRRCDCNRIFPKAISHSVSLIIMATAITSARWPNSKSPERGLPNEAQAYLAIGAIQRRQGKWAESTANLEKAATLDPKNTNVLVNLCFSYIAQRNFETADKILDRAIAAVAAVVSATAALKAFMAVLWKGDLSAAEKVFSSAPPETDPEGLITWVRAWDSDARAEVSGGPSSGWNDFAVKQWLLTTTAPSPKAFLEGMIYLLQGDKDESAGGVGARAPGLGKTWSAKLPRLLPDTGSMALSLLRWVKRKKRSPKASAPSNYCRNPRTPWMGRKPPLRSPRFMPGPGNSTKHFACSIICSRSQTTSPSRCSSSIQPGTRSQRPALPSFDRKYSPKS